MDTQTGSRPTYISESMINIVQIPTENPEFRPQRDRRKCRGHCINDRQPEVADKTGNTCSAETMTDRIEIMSFRRRKCGVYEHGEIEKVSSSGLR